MVEYDTGLRSQDMTQVENLRERIESLSARIVAIRDSL